MANDIGQNKTEKETQNEAVPTSEQKTPKTDKVQEVAAEQEAEAQSQKEGLLDTASERTREQFEKLQEQLRTERAQKEYLAQVLNEAQSAKEETPKSLIDPDTGLVDEAAITDLQRQLSESNKRAKNAERSVQEFLVKQEEREMISSNPELDPNSKDYDKSLRTLAEGIYYHSMVNPQEYGNKQLSPTEAAAEAKKLMASKAKEGEEKGAKAAVEQITPKEQASLEVRGGAKAPSVDDSELGARTRRGDKAALIERLKKAGFIKSQE